MKVIIILALLIFTSCSHMMRSGKYVQLNRNMSDAKAVSRVYNVDVETLKRHNLNKKFRAGEWVFVPQKLGLSSYFDDLNETMYTTSQSGEYIWPVPSSYKISSHYGMRKSKHHDGIDIPAKIGSHILSVKEGVVIYSDKRIGGYGNMVIIKHANNVYSVYGHARKLFVSKGDKISQGQVIAQVGMTGRTSGPHLHFEVRIGDNPKNPMSFLSTSSGKLAKH